MIELQKLGERLTELPQSRIDRLALGAPLLYALDEMKRIKAHGARRRHLRRIGKLLREEDVEAIRNTLGDVDDRHAAETHHFHRIERWRDRLIDEQSALGEFLQAYPEADRQQLRQLIRNALKERQQEKPPAASRKLFKLLREIMD